MSEHTPGPWKAGGQDRGGCKCRLIWLTSVDVLVAQSLMASDELCQGEGVACLEEAKANARLIAAAPDLREACQTFLRVWHRAGPLGSSQFEKFDVVVRACGKAIAKYEDPAGDPETWDAAEEEARRRTVTDGKPWGVARNERGNPCVRLAEDPDDPEDLDLTYPPPT